MSLTRSHHRATRVVIDTSAYRHNLERVRSLVPNAKVMAVIKADGYGHGMEVTADALVSADEFGVTDLDDVERLRQHGVDKPLNLLSSRFSAQELMTFSERNLRPVFYDFSQFGLLKELPSNANLDLWLKVDTGMGRLGLSVEDAHVIFDSLVDNPAVRSVSAMTHLANADNPNHPGNRRQLAQFAEFIEGHAFQDISLLNSAGTVAFSEHAYDFVRPGLMLYGISPQQNSSADQLALKPVMTFKSELISVKHLPAGSPIGYGSTYTLDTDSRIGVIAAGYGDGYPRHAPSGTPVLVNDLLVPLIGRVSMDLIAVELGELPAEVGDEVVLWGANNPIENIAEMADTISYELTCGITQRVERIII